MEIFYQDKDITELVNVRKCIVRDTAGKRCDSLEVEFENEAGWYSWGPEKDDRIVIKHNGYNSGTMYVNSILTESGYYRILAASLPCAAREKASRAYYQKSIEHIMRDCAAASGMGFRIFGIDGAQIIPYIERNNEGCASFLDRLLMLEGAALKCIDGKYTAIGISYAQDLQAVQEMELLAGEGGAAYQRCGTPYRRLTVKTPYACSSAEDSAVPETCVSITECGLPAMDDIQAARWARGMLLALNRKCESVRAQGDFNAGMTAMIRIDIGGDTDASGEWITEEVEHDLVNLKTTVLLRRCIRTIR